MASNEGNISSDDDVSFSEWHFVTKACTTNEEYSDDDSIEIIEREVLKTITPSSSDAIEDEEGNRESVKFESEVPVENLMLETRTPSTPDLEVPSIETANKQDESLCVDTENHAAGYTFVVENLETVDLLDECHYVTVENNAASDLFAENVETANTPNEHPSVLGENHDVSVTFAENVETTDTLDECPCLGVENDGVNDSLVENIETTDPCLVVENNTASNSLAENVKTTYTLDGCPCLVVENNVASDSLDENVESTITIRVMMENGVTNFSFVDNVETIDTLDGYPKNVEPTDTLDECPCVVVENDAASDSYVDNVTNTSDDCHCEVAENHASSDALHNLSRKIFYSCMVAALAGIIIHQYREYLFSKWWSGAYRENIDYDHDYVRDDEFETGRKEMRRILEEKQHLTEEYYTRLFGFFKSIYYLKKGVYFTEISFEPGFSHNPIGVGPVIDRKIMYIEKLLSDSAVKCPDYADLLTVKLPLLCKEKSFVRLILTKKQYRRIFSDFLYNLRSEEKLYKLFEDSLLDTIRSKETLFPEDEQVTADPSNHNHNLVEEVGISNQNKDTPSIDGKAYHKENTETPPKMKEENKPEPENNISQINLTKQIIKAVDDHLNELKIKSTQMTEKLKSYFKKLDKKLKKMNPMLYWKDNECMHDCNQSEEPKSPKKLEDELSEKVSNESSSDAEWILKRGKARERRRKHHEGKIEKKYSEKKSDNRESNESHSTPKSEENKFEDEFVKHYQHYKAWIKRTQEKMKTDYKIFTSNVKSKFKKLGDSMKKNYNKLMSSNWKHYAKSIFQRFRF